MKITYGAITKPSFLLLNPDLPSLTAQKHRLFSNPFLRIPRRHEKLIGLVSSSRYSTAERASPTKSPASSRPGKRQDGRISLPPPSPSPSGRSGLFETKSERAESRARVYEFLRGLGIVPDELDGLELPVTAAVMRERVDFLQSLGLKIEDINAYPLVLGCSVKKNMIPVLDYLGKLGVRKSTFTEFLRRYPQVLHASVVVDLTPVVKYLQGLDIKPIDIPRVLEKYPEVLGFKLEGTMSTSVAYLVGIGVARREIGGVLTKYPEVLGMRVGRVIKPFVEYLESLGLPRLAVARLIENRPQMLGFGLEERVKPNSETLVGFCVRKASLASVVAQYPEILGLDLEPKLRSQRALLESLVGVDEEEFGRAVERMPQVVSLGGAAVTKRVEFLFGCGFERGQARSMVAGCPQLLGMNLEVMRLGFKYFVDEMGRPIEELVGFPAFFTYGLESTVRPRHRMVARRGLQCSLSWMLNCSDERFRQRMEYDTIDMDEMESPEPEQESLDMRALMEPRSDGSGSESDDDDDYYEDSDGDD